MKLVVLPEAVQDIDRLYDFLVAEDPIAAQKAMLALEKGISTLLKSPRLGVEMAHNVAYRQFFVPFGRSAYVLRYRLDTDNKALVIVRVWHGRENRRRPPTPAT